MSQFSGEGLDVLKEECLPVRIPLSVEQLFDLSNEFKRGLNAYAPSVDNRRNDTQRVAHDCLS